MRIFITSLTLALLIITPVAFADTTGRTSFTGEIENPLGETTGIIDVIDRVFTWLVGFVAVVAPIIIVIAAFQMLFSWGNPEAFKKARTTILYTVIGFVIILMAKGIISIVTSVLKG